MAVLFTLKLFLIAVMAAVFLFTLFQVVIQIFYALLPNFRLTKKNIVSEPFVSIHIAAYNEPPVLLNNTFNALSKLSYGNYEVLALDNNTQDEKIWKPVQEYVGQLGEKFRFFHIEKLDGFKAGALNYLKEKTSPEAVYVAVIDADYQIKENFLHEALSYFTDDQIAFVQFPQSYLNTANTNKGISLEYQCFFDTYMKAANHFDCVNVTGTLTVIKVAALRQIGAYDITSTTEDADYGFRLIAAGYKGIYVPEIIGQGLMPYDLEAYKKQKARWAKGNATIIRKQMFQLLLKKNVTIKQKLGIFSQLTAWLNLTIIPTFLLLVTALYVLVSGKNLDSLTQWAVLLASLTIFTYILFKFLYYQIQLSKQFGFLNALRACLIHLGMNWVYASSIKGLIMAGELSFERTNKFILPKMPSLVKNTFPELVIATISLALALELGSKGNFFLIPPLLVIAGIYLLIFYVLKEINTTKPVSARVLNSIAQNSQHSVQ